MVFGHKIFFSSSMIMNVGDGCHYRLRISFGVFAAIIFYPKLPPLSFKLSLLTMMDVHGTGLLLVIHRTWWDMMNEKWWIKIEIKWNRNFVWIQYFLKEINNSMMLLTYLRMYSAKVSWPIESCSNALVANCVYASKDD